MGLALQQLKAQIAALTTAMGSPGSAAAVAAIKAVVDADKLVDDLGATAAGLTAATGSLATATALAALLVPVADTGNSHALASVNIGVLVPGAWQAWEQFDRLDINFTVVQASAALGFVIQQGTGTDVAVSEAWTAAEAESHGFSVARDKFCTHYRVQYTQGAAAGNVTIACKRAFGPVGAAAILISPVSVAAGGGGTPHILPRAVGARKFGFTGVAIGGGTGNANIKQLNGSEDVVDFKFYGAGVYNVFPEIPLDPSAVSVRVGDQGAGGLAGSMYWYP
jgi:hypothetical protein